MIVESQERLVLQRSSVAAWKNGGNPFLRKEVGIFPTRGRDEFWLPDLAVPELPEVVKGAIL